MIPRLEVGAALRSDIQRLWKTSEQRYVADPAAAQAAIGPSYSQWQDFPDDVGQVRLHHARDIPSLDRHAICDTLGATRARCNLLFGISLHTCQVQSVHLALCRLPLHSLSRAQD